MTVPTIMIGKPNASSHWAINSFFLILEKAQQRQPIILLNLSGANRPVAKIKFPKDAIRVTVRPVELFVARYKRHKWGEFAWRVFDRGGTVFSTHKTETEAKEAAFSRALKLFRTPKEYREKYAMRLRQWNQLATDQLCKEPKD
jgi:hypothetical protein